MKIEQQVTSLEISKRLKELGVKQESLFWWRLGYSTSESFDNGVSLGKHGNFRDYELTYYPKPRYGTADLKWNQADLQKLYETELSAFTVAELGEMLPSWIGHPQELPRKTEDKWSFQIKGFYDLADTEADARGKMLICLLENNLLST